MNDQVVQSQKDLASSVHFSNVPRHVQQLPRAKLYRSTSNQKQRRDSGSSFSSLAIIASASGTGAQPEEVPHSARAYIPRPAAVKRVGVAGHGGGAGGGLARLSSNFSLSTLNRRCSEASLPHLLPTSVQQDAIDPAAPSSTLPLPSSSEAPARQTSPAARAGSAQPRPIAHVDLGAAPPAAILPSSRAILVPLEQSRETLSSSLLPARHHSPEDARFRHGDGDTGPDESIRALQGSPSLAHVRSKSAEPRSPSLEEARHHRIVPTTAGDAASADRPPSDAGARAQIGPRPSVRWAVVDVTLASASAGSTAVITADAPKPRAQLPYTLLPSLPDSHGAPKATSATLPASPPLSPDLRDASPPSPHTVQVDVSCSSTAIAAGASAVLRPGTTHSLAPLAARARPAPIVLPLKSEADIPAEPHSAREAASRMSTSPSGSGTGSAKADEAVLATTAPISARGERGILALPLSARGFAPRAERLTSAAPTSPLACACQPEIAPQREERCSPASLPLSPSERAGSRPQLFAEGCWAPATALPTSPREVVVSRPALAGPMTTTAASPQDENSTPTSGGGGGDLFEEELDASAVVALLPAHPAAPSHHHFRPPAASAGSASAASMPGISSAQPGVLAPPPAQGEQLSIIAEPPALVAASSAAAAAAAGIVSGVGGGPAVRFLARPLMGTRHSAVLMASRASAATKSDYSTGDERPSSKNAARTATRTTTAPTISADSLTGGARASSSLAAGDVGEPGGVVPTIVPAPRARSTGPADRPLPPLGAAAPGPRADTAAWATGRRGRSGSVGSAVLAAAENPGLYRRPAMTSGEDERVEAITSTVRMRARGGFESIAVPTLLELSNADSAGETTGVDFTTPDDEGPLEWSQPSLQPPPAAHAVAGEPAARALPRRPHTVLSASATATASAARPPAARPPAAPGGGSGTAHPPLAKGGAPGGAAVGRAGAASRRAPSPGVPAGSATAAVTLLRRSATAAGAGAASTRGDSIPGMCGAGGDNDLFGIGDGGAVEAWGEEAPARRGVGTSVTGARAPTNAEFESLWNLADRAPGPLVRGRSDTDANYTGDSPPRRGPAPPATTSEARARSSSGPLNRPSVTTPTHQPRALKLTTGTSADVHAAPPPACPTTAVVDNSASALPQAGLLPPQQSSTQPRRRSTRLSRAAEARAADKPDDWAEDDDAVDSGDGDTAGDSAGEEPVAVLPGSGGMDSAAGEQAKCTRVRRTAPEKGARGKMCRRMREGLAPGGEATHTEVGRGNTSEAAARKGGAEVRADVEAAAKGPPPIEKLSKKARLALLEATIGALSEQTGGLLSLVKGAERGGEVRATLDVHARITTTRRFLACRLPSLACARCLIAFLLALHCPLFLLLRRPGRPPPSAARPRQAHLSPHPRGHG